MSTEHLHEAEAIEKLQSMVEKIGIAMLSTFEDSKRFPHSVPMSCQEVDTEGNLWFVFSVESETYKHIMKSPKASLTFASVNDKEFLSINTNAQILSIPTRIDMYWNPTFEAWFDGKDDPNIRLLKLTPEEAHYWDSGKNKLVTFLKMATSAITGIKTDVGKEGDLNI